MTQLTNPSANRPTTLYCYKHPDRETLLRCGKCDRPICTKCMVRHPVGIRCKECAQVRKDPLTNLTLVQYALAFVTALVCGIVGGFIGVQIGFFAIFIGPLIGGAIAEVVGRVIGYKRGLKLQIIVGTCIALGAFIAELAMGLLPFIGLLSALPQDLPPAARNAPSMWSIALATLLPRLTSTLVYVVFAIGGAIARLR